MKNYEERYKKALERARMGLHVCNLLDCDNMTRRAAITTIYHLFPELTEDEDERIRKGIIRNLQYLMDRSEGFVKEDLQERIAWLEKQGEKKNTSKREIDDAYLQGICDAKHAIEKQGESPRTNIEIPFGANDSELQEVSYDVPEGSYAEIKDGRVVIKKVEPKFKNGQWIVWQDKCYKVNYNGCGYELIDQNGLSTSLEYGTIDKNAHLWDITKDAKDGDVLVDSYSKDSIIILYKGIYKERTILAHCGWNGYNLTVNTNGFGYGGLDNTNYLPATKEQRNLLFQKMKDSGYEWNADKKELKKIKQKSTDNVEPKFHEGDWIVTPENKVLQITSIEGTSYRFNNESHYWEICYCDEKCHLWTIEDARDGDVLATSAGAFIYNDKNGGDSRPGCYCGINTLGKFQVSSGKKWTNKEVYPATKEQRDLLFAKMHDAGYEWDAKKKQLKKIEPKTLNADKVVEWMRVKAPKWLYDMVYPIRLDVDAEDLIKQFKKDFGI